MGSATSRTLLNKGMIQVYDYFTLFNFHSPSYHTELISALSSVAFKLFYDTQLLIWLS